MVECRALKKQNLHNRDWKWITSTPINTYSLRYARHVLFNALKETMAAFGTSIILYWLSDLRKVYAISFKKVKFP